MKITFNGKEYNDAEAMPPEVRQAYELSRQVLNVGSAQEAKPRMKIKVSTNVHFFHQGKTYSSVDELPPEARMKYQAAMQQIDKNGNGIPDFLEADSASGALAEPTAADPFYDQASTPIAPVSAQPPVISSERSGMPSAVIMASVIVLLLIVIFGLVLYIFQH
ncbi:MAG TPA: hypothetical protein VMJ64_08600 [Anaerolineales bacterium]|nr:hypothetical protein [Anaerolineales bacterium]